MRNSALANLGLMLLLQLRQCSFCLLNSVLEFLCLLRQSIAFAGGNVDLSLNTVDLVGPRLELLLFGFDLIMERSRLVYNMVLLGWSVL